MNVIQKLILIITSSLFAQTKAPLTHVTVFPQGATLEHTVKLNLKAGEQTLILSGLTPYVQPQSLMVSASNYVTVLSYNFKPKLTEELPVVEPSERDLKKEQHTQKLQQQIERIQRLIQSKEEVIKAHHQSINVILEHKRLYDEKQVLHLETLEHYIKFYQQQVEESQTKLLKLKDEQVALTDSITLLKLKLEELNKTPVVKEKEKPQKEQGYLELTLLTENATETEVTLSYFHQNASWTPSYDILCESIDQALKVKYKAHVTQNTGISWDKVNLSLATTQPNVSNTQPILSAWYLAIYNNYYAIKNNSNIAMNTIPQLETQKDKTTLLMDDLAETVDLAVNFAFDIKVPYSVPTDGKLHSVLIQTLNVPCTYKHYTVPKLDKDVFLLAELEDFEAFNFLPGEAQVFLEGKFTGKTLIDPFVTTESMNISLGRDKGVVVKRERVKDQQSKNFLGTTRTDNYEYKITLKNNRNKAIDLIVKDQYPLSNNAQITVERKGHSKDGSVNEDNGVVTWIEALKAKSSKELKISYSITRPKDWQIR